MTHAAPSNHPSDDIEKFLSDKGLFEQLDNLRQNVGEKASKLVISSMEFLGVPYRAGGTNSNTGFDCSGFVRHCYSYTLGIKTPASSHEYNRYGVAVNIDDCRPGDVICFNGSRIGSRIGHVGIITEVSKENIYFIHSAIRGGIRFDQLNAPYYLKRFVGIRRIIL